MMIRAIIAAFLVGGFAGGDNETIGPIHSESPEAARALLYSGGEPSSVGTTGASYSLSSEAATAIGGAASPWSFAPQPPDPNPGASPQPGPQPPGSTTTALPNKDAVRAGIGFTEDPDLFLLSFGYDHFVKDNFALGPLVQMGVEDDEFLFAPTLNLSWHAGFPDVKELSGHLMAGVGFAYLSDDDRRRDEDDIGALVNFGGGVNFAVNENLKLGSTMLFNVMPGEVLDENFFFSWQVITVTFPL